MWHLPITRYTYKACVILLKKYCKYWSGIQYPPPPPAPLLGKRLLTNPAPHFPVRFTIFFLGFSFVLLYALFYLLGIFRYLFEVSHKVVTIYLDSIPIRLVSHRPYKRGTLSVVLRSLCIASRPLRFTQDSHDCISILYTNINTNLN